LGGWLFNRNPKRRASATGTIAIRAFGGKLPEPLFSTVIRIGAR